MPGQDVALEIASDDAHRRLYEILADAHEDDDTERAEDLAA